MKTIITLLFIFMAVTSFSQPNFHQRDTITDPIVVTHSTFTDYIDTGNVRMIVEGFKAVSHGTRLFYVSNSGDDSNDGLTDSTAWKTINKVNTYSFSVGDLVLFQRGGTWDSTIMVQSFVTYASYGTGNKPKIYGWKTISGFTLYSGSIYKVNLGSDVPNQVFDNGRKMIISRFPDIDTTSFLDNPWYVYTDAITNDSVITVSELSTRNDSGATAGLRPVGWGYDFRLITAKSGSDITVDYSKNIYGLGTGDPLSINGSIEDLKEGTYAFNRLTGDLYVWLDGGRNPASRTITISSQEDGFYGENVDNVTINNLDIRYFNQSGIDFRGDCDSISINNCDLIYNYDFGIEAWRNVADNLFVNLGFSHFKINRNYIYGSNSGGIYLSDDYHTVKNNTIREIGRIWNAGVEGYHLEGYMAQEKLQAIRSKGDYNYFGYNDFFKIGYNGILSNGISNIIEYNISRYTCSTLVDGGDYYTNTPSPGQIWRYNYAGFSSSLNREDVGFGFYADGDQTGNSYIGNISEGNTWGMLVNSRANDSILTVQNNLFYNNKEKQFRLFFYPSTSGTVSNYNISGNTFISVEDSQELVSLYLDGDTIPSGMTMDNDTLISLFDNTPNSIGNGANKSIYALQSLGIEANAYSPNFGYVATTAIDTIGSEIVGRYNDFSVDPASYWYSGSTRWSADSLALIYPFTTGYSLIQLKERTINVAVGDSLSLQLAYSIVSKNRNTGNSGNISVTSQAGTVKFPSQPITTDWQSYVVYADVSDTILNKRFDFGLYSSSGDTIFLDNVYMYLVHTSLVDQSAYAAIFFNDDTHPVSVDLGMFTKAIDGTTLPTPYTLQAREVLVGFKND